MLMQLIEGALVGAGVLHGMTLARKKLSSVKKDDGTMNWAWYNQFCHQGFYCPKCSNVNSNKKQPTICSCEEYHKEHFHFKCNTCSYTNIMRTFDDKK